MPAKRARALAFLLGLAAAYLCLVNLDYAGYWSDEAATRNISAVLLATGDISGWDGRNLTGGTNGRTLNHALRDPLPPLQYLLTAAGLALFGDNPVGARAPHALAGLAGIALFYLYLRLFLHGRRQRRMLLLTLAFIVLSVDLSLYLRQARYFSLTLLTLAAMLYGYERFYREGSMRHWLLMAGGALLGFFSHYTNGTAAIVALGCWHLLFRARTTEARTYAALLAAVLPVAALGGAYLSWMGLFAAGSHSAIAGLEFEQGKPALDLLLRLRDYPLAAIANDWLPYPLLVWYCIRHGRTRLVPAQADERAVAKLLALGLLYLCFISVFAVQLRSVVEGPVDHRYFFTIIPFFSLLKAAFVNWLWDRYGSGFAIPAFALMLLSNITSYPINTVNYYTGESTFGWRLPQHLGALHRPYNHPLDGAAGLLDERAAQDDLVYVERFFNREKLIAANGGRFIYCCHFDLADEDARTLSARLPAAAALTTHPFEADWQLLEVVPGQLPDELLFHYAIVATGEHMLRFTQRPAPHTHSFRPIPYQRSFVLLQRRGDARLGVPPARP